MSDTITVNEVSEKTSVGAPTSLELPSLSSATFFVLLFVYAQIVITFLLGIVGAIVGTFYVGVAVTWSVLLTHLLLTVLVYVNVKNNHGNSFAAIGFVRPKTSFVKTSVFIVGVLAILWAVEWYYVQAFDVELQPEIAAIISELQANGFHIDLGLFLLVTTISAPLVEEVIFRGYLQTAAVKKFGAVAGISLSSFVFAVIHFDLTGFPLLILAGAGMGLLYHWSKSIWPTIILHLANNTLAMSLLI